VHGLDIYRGAKGVEFFLNIWRVDGGFTAGELDASFPCLPSVYGYVGAVRGNVLGYFYGLYASLFVHAEHSVMIGCLLHRLQFLGRFCLCFGFPFLLSLLGFLLAFVEPISCISIQSSQRKVYEGFRTSGTVLDLFPCALAAPQVPCYHQSAWHLLFSSSSFPLYHPLPPLSTSVLSKKCACRL
jgi:hypothetical protein